MMAAPTETTNATLLAKIHDAALRDVVTDVIEDNITNQTTTEINAKTNMVAGTLRYDSTLNKLKFYNGSAWETVTSS